MSTPHDELESTIVDALEAEGNGVEPGTDAAWQRLEGATRRPRRRVRAGLVFGAVATAAATVAAVVLLQDRDPEVDTGPASPDVTTEITVPADPPDRIVAVRSNGGLSEIVLLDGSGRVEREIETDIDLVATLAVELSPDGRWVYFSGCCVGYISRLPVTGGEPQRLDIMGAPSVSPDGVWMAGNVSQGEDWFGAVTRADGSGEPLVSTFLDGSLYRPAWSPDGRRVAFADRDWQQTGEAHVVELTFDGTSLGEPVDRGQGTQGFYSADGTLHVFNDLDLAGSWSWSPDPATSWVLEVTKSGVLQYHNTDFPEDPPVVLGEGYGAADW